MSQLKKNISYNLLLTIAQLIFPVFSVPYISRVLSPDGLGKVNFTDSLSYYFVTLSGLGITSFGIREIARFKNNKNSLNNIASGLLSLNIAGGILFLLVYWIALFFVYNRINNFSLVIFSSVFIIANSITCEWYFLGTEKFRYIALRTLLIRLLGLVCIFLFVKKAGDFYLYYAIMVGSVLLIAFWNLKVFFDEVKFHFDFKNWKVFFSKTKIMYFTSVLLCVSLMLDNVLLGLVASSAAVSFYTLSSKVVRIASSLISDSFYVLYPNSVSALHNEEQGRYQQLIFTSFQWICMIALPLCFGIFLFANDFTGIYFGPDFNSVSIGIKILSVYPLLRTVGLFFNLQILMPHNYEAAIFRSLLISVIIFVPANLVLSHYLSFTGTCISLLISELTIVVVNYYFVWKNCSFLKFISAKNLLQILIGLLLFIPVYYACKNLFNNQLVFLLAGIVSCVVAYSAFLLIIKNRFALEFFKMLKTYLKK